MTPRRPFRFLFIALLLCSTGAACAQAPSADANPNGGRILLVLPFDNLTPAAAPNSKDPDPTSLDWIREAVPEILNSRFTSAGFFPLTREDRLYALDHLGLPESFDPSRATALRIAQTLDANFILIGHFTVTSGTLNLSARILDVGRLRLSSELTATGPLAKLIPLMNSLAWQLSRQLDPSFAIAEETFRAADANLRLDAFEQYIRGITERDPDERLRHLKKATDLSPDFTAAWRAIGKQEFDTQQYEEAAPAFGKVTRSDPADLESAFYRGLALLYSGDYPHAEEAFAAIDRVLPLAEVVNNQAVAVSRRNRDAIALFRQALAADPNDADYHFNVAVSLARHGDLPEARTEIAESLKLHPSDAEAKAAQAAWQSATVAAPPADSSSAAGPLERIKRSYNGAAFRQASQMLEQVEEARLAALPGPQRAAKLASSAREKLDRGLFLEAERGYQAALVADNHSAEAHAGLAQVRERAGDPEDARKQAQAALTFPSPTQPKIDAYLVLARLDLAANNLTQAREDAASALKIDPNNRPARDLRKSIDTRLDSPPAPTKP